MFVRVMDSGHASQWEKFGVEACGHLDGMFSFVLTDSVKVTHPDFAVTTHLN
jgi:hypothetical protein